MGTETRRATLTLFMVFGGCGHGFLLPFGFLRGGYSLSFSTFTVTVTVIHRRFLFTFRYHVARARAARCTPQNCGTSFVGAFSPRYERGVHKRRRVPEPSVICGSVRGRGAGAG